MIKQPKISIIIPVYNVTEYIGECLQSVMRQTYTGEIECVLVDDCGTDNSIAVAEQLIAEYKGPIKFCILHHEHNRGLSAARNTGTDAATGDYIYYLDSDDYISDDCLEVLAEPLKKREYDLILGDIDSFWGINNQKYLFVSQNEIIGNEAIFACYADRLLFVMAWNKLCNLSFLRKNHITFLEGQLHEDELWTYIMMHNIDSIAIEHTITYFYRVREGSIATTSNLNNGKKAESYFDTIQYIILHPHKDAEAYSKVVAFYAKMYINIALASGVRFYSQYKYIRRHYHQEEATSKFGIQLHFRLPILLGYCYARAWSICRNMLKKSK